MSTSKVVEAPKSAEPSILEEKKESGTLKTPLPTPTSTSSVPEKPALTASQQTKYEWLLKQIQGWTEVPSKEKPGPLTDSEKMWLTRECLLRYLRATKWHEKEAEKRLQETLAWRREYGVEELSADQIGPENETGKQILLGYDKHCRPCHYLSPGRQNTDVSPRQVQHLVFMLERVIELMPAQQETLSLLINFKSGKNRTNTAPGIGQGREVLHILQTHYPERLGRAMIINVPWVVWGFFKLITPFIDPLTREKLKFNEDMTQFVPKEQLWSEFPGGELQFEYNHEVYWPALQKLCAEKRAEKVRRWEAGGKQIGEKEDYLKGHDAQGVSPPPGYSSEANN
ncbi:CRAL/TRIO domain-containing protein [Annulohypoxylon truncatum]|uniref:CRAL/TRIO domain-containing protein n=1 Tax=Annulohypoxylon truncatum TaxID=327061 RepID=UPI0020085C02|nr:CRAL/TRIO domain-containing protein [Annulohypoxylon truncatum]KAI1214524.1 CRAL/TRIO domain-containing protein [Annulohypoxylon truncatum]